VPVATISMIFTHCTCPVSGGVGCTYCTCSVGGNVCHAHCTCSVSGGVGCVCPLRMLQFTVTFFSHGKLSIDDSASTDHAVRLVYAEREDDVMNLKCGELWRPKSHTIWSCLCPHV